MLGWKRADLFLWERLQQLSPCKRWNLSSSLYERVCRYLVRHLAFPAPPQWYGLVGVGGEGGGGLACAKSGLASWVGCCCARPGVTERAEILRKPYASHKPYNVGRVPVLLTLTCTTQA